jgi:hypothetical protein
MKKITVFAISFSAAIIYATIYADVLNIGYKEFSLGQSREETKQIISSKYGGKTVKYLTNGDVLLSLDEMIQANIFYDHKGIVYKINVQLKYGDISEVRKRMVDKYGQPNDYTGEEWDGANKLYLAGRWLVEKKYTIALWESYYCRNQKFIPCYVEVDYLDTHRREIKETYERNLKESEKRKIDNKKYDGF